MSTRLKAPFPYFGGKSKISDMVWQHFGNCPNYIEPFFGSGAVLLGRPEWHRRGSWPTETINDADCFLSNFWRSIRNNPQSVAHWADWPVNEVDLLARHKWLINQDYFRQQMRTDPDFFDPKIAGWWVWGLCSWIGQGWCSTETEQLPHLGDAGRGINRKLPHLGNAGRAIESYFSQLAERLRNVRVCCGDWSRVLGDSVTTKHGITGVFLDPPYGSERSKVYAIDSTDISRDTMEWAVKNGDNPLYRIALCGYSDGHQMPGTWNQIAWKANGGYGSRANGRGRDNCTKERIWFSPHCLKYHQLSTFTDRA